MAFEGVYGAGGPTPRRLRCHRWCSGGLPGSTLLVPNRGQCRVGLISIRLRSFCVSAPKPQHHQFGQSLLKAREAFRGAASHGQRS